MTASEETAEPVAADEESAADEDESVPNGEEDIDELGRNPTQQRMDERGEPPVR
jgi:hypothetical protein